SATGQAMALDTLLRMNANGFLLKPVHPDDLLEKIASLLAMKKSSQEALYDELSFFYAQITPHFLYNTFNTIIGLSYKDPEKAREALRSEERRVGKECRVKWWTCQEEKKKENYAEVSTANSIQLEVRSSTG